MMGIKVCFNDEIHRILELPDTLTALVDTISAIWPNKLPQNWKVYGNNVDETSVMISSEDQYKEFIDAHCVIDSAIKFYIVPIEEIQEPEQEDELQKLVSDIAERLGYLKNEEEADQDSKDSGLGEEAEIRSNKSISQNNREKAAQADNSEASESLRRYEVYPQARPRPKDEGHDNSRKMHKAKHLMEKMASGRLSEAKMDLLKGKLEKIQENLSTEQREKLQKKKDKGEEESSNTMYKAKRLLEKLARGRLSEAKVNHLQEKLASIQESLSPEQREKLQKKKEEAVMHYNKKDFQRQEKIKLREFCEGEESYEKLRKVVLQQNPSLLFNMTEMEATSHVDAEGRVLHENVSCSGCGVSPIVGTRYKCSVCANFDFCEKCESTQDHPHAFLKLKQGRKAMGVPVAAGSQEEGEVGNRMVKLLESVRKVNIFMRVKKMIKAIKRGDARKFNKCRGKLFEKYPEEAKVVIDAAEDWYPMGKQGLVDEWKSFKRSRRGGKMKGLRVSKRESERYDRQHSREMGMTQSVSNLSPEEL